MSRRPVEVFSLSFLDVIACAVGAILFITILSVFQSVAGMDTRLAEEFSQAESDSRVVERMTQQLKDAQEIESKLKVLRAEVEQTTTALAEAKTRAEQNQEAAKLQQEIDQLKVTATRAGAVARVIQRSNPQARDSARMNDMFLAFIGGGEVRTVTRGGSRGFQSEHYKVASGFSDVTLTANGKSINIDEGLQASGQLTRFISQFDSRQVYAECYVTPNSFEDFFKVREYLISQGFEVGILFLEDVDELYYGTGGTRSRVQ